MEQALKHFQLKGKPISCSPHGEGHINLTYLVETDAGQRYILQRLSRAAFQNIPGLMGNIIAVTEFLTRKSTDVRSCLHLVRTTDGAYYHRDKENEYWRVYDFIEDSLCLQTAESPEDFYQSALAFGRFQQDLRDSEGISRQMILHNKTSHDAGLTKLYRQIIILRRNGETMTQ